MQLKILSHWRGRIQYYRVIQWWGRWRQWSHWNLLLQYRTLYKQLRLNLLQGSRCHLRLPHRWLKREYHRLVGWPCPGIGWISGLYRMRNIPRRPPIIGIWHQWPVGTKSHGSVSTKGMVPISVLIMIHRWFLKDKKEVEDVPELNKLPK